MTAVASAMSHLDEQWDRETRLASRLLFRYARVLDEGDYATWPCFFTDGGTYAVTTAENDHDKGMWLFVDRGREAINERAAYVLGYWSIPQRRTRHVVSNVLVVAADADRITCRSNLVLYRVNRRGEITLHATADYRDEIVVTPDGPRFDVHQVVLDASTMPADMSALL